MVKPEYPSTTSLRGYKKTMTYDVGNLSPGSGQAPKCGGVKPVNGDPNPPLLKTYLSGIQKSLSIRILCHVVFFLI